MVNLVFGFGINDVKERSSNGNCPYKKRWRLMLSRCFKGDEPSYHDKQICEEWRRLSNFKAWMQEQNWEGLHLDKDILVKGNKVYCPETCVFVPGYVNTSLNDSARGRGEYPIGVYKVSDKSYKSKPYKANIRVRAEKRKFLGYFATPEEAHKAWQWEKSIYLENIINEYSKESCFRADVADALMSRVWQLRLDYTMGVETIDI